MMMMMTTTTMMMMMMIDHQPMHQPMMSHLTRRKKTNTKHTR